MEIKRNDILVEQFGSTMVLYSFYKVLAVKGKTVTLYPLESKSSGWIGFMQNEVKPIDTNVYWQKNVITKRINKFGELNMGKYRGLLNKYDSNRQYVESHND